MSCVFSSQDQFCPFSDQFCGFAYIIRLGDDFCLGITFAVVQGQPPKVKMTGKTYVQLLPLNSNHQEKNVRVIHLFCKSSATLFLMFELSSILILKSVSNYIVWKLNRYTNLLNFEEKGSFCPPNRNLTLSAKLSCEISN